MLSGFFKTKFYLALGHALKYLQGALQAGSTSTSPQQKASNCPGWEPPKGTIFFFQASIQTKLHNLGWRKGGEGTYISSIQSRNRRQRPSSHRLHWKKKKKKDNEKGGTQPLHSWVENRLSPSTSFLQETAGPTRRGLTDTGPSDS